MMEKREDNLSLIGIIDEICRESETKSREAVQTLANHLGKFGAVRTASVLYMELDEACGGLIFRKIMGDEGLSSQYDIVQGEDLTEHCVVDLDAMRDIFGRHLRSFLSEQIKLCGLERLRAGRAAVVIQEKELVESLSQAQVVHDLNIPDMVLVTCMRKLIEKDNPGFEVEYSPKDEELILSYEMLRLEDDE